MNKSYEYKTTRYHNNVVGPVSQTDEIATAPRRWSSVIKFTHAINVFLNIATM